MLFETIVEILTFFFAFSACSIGFYLRSQIYKLLPRRHFKLIYNTYLVVAAILTLRSFCLVLGQIQIIPLVIAQSLSTLCLLGLAGSLFFMYWRFEVLLKRLVLEKDIKS
jgi:Na+/citrate or Na+/malate symporter